MPEIDLSEMDIEPDVPIMGAGRSQGIDRANVIEQIDPEKMILSIKHILAGEQQDDDGNWYVPIGSEPYMNNIGINSIATFLRMIITKNLIFTNYAKQELQRVLLEIELDINDHLRMNSNRFEIKPENFILVVDMIIHPIEAAYYRSGGGVTMDFVGNVTKQINTNRDIMPNMGMYNMPREGIISKAAKKFMPFK